MKKNIWRILVAMVFSQSMYGQACFPVQGASAAITPTLPLTKCPDMSIFYPQGNSATTIPLNFIFLKPLSGTGKFDTISAASCQHAVSRFNRFFDSLMPPTHPLPNNPPIFLNKVKINFTFKSISKVASQHYAWSNVPNAPTGIFNTDSTALNLIFLTHSGNTQYYGAAVLSNNEAFIIETVPGWSDALRNEGHLHLVVHEICHALGLDHTNIPSPPSNPTGTILPNPPVDDYWLEDPATYGGTNNFMTDSWGRSYLSPKQIYFMHRNLRNHPVLKRMVSSYGSTGNCTADPNDTWEASGTNTLSGGWLAPPGNIVIKSGADITLSDCMRMTNGAKIIVEPGAKFSIINGGVTTKCWGQWEGIEVRSNVNAVQALSSGNPNMPASNVGMLRLYDAELSNAKTAVTIGELNSSGAFVAKTAAGILHSENSKYLNNVVGVKFNSYFILGNVTDNMSYFKRDTFVVDVKDYMNPTLPIASVIIDKTQNIEFLGCYFRDIDLATSTAIKCTDGSIIVKDHCSSISGGNCNGVLTRNTFIGFRRVISINTAFITNPSLIDHVDVDQRSPFTPPNLKLGNQVEGGIYVVNNFGTQITNSRIRIIKKPDTNLPYTYGIYLDNVDGYVVENNFIDGLAPSYCVGIYVNNSGPGSNSIYNNTLSQLGQGIWTQNMNYDPPTGSGLTINCNDFFSSKFNIGVQAVQGASCPPPCSAVTFPTGIATVQGIPHSTDAQRYTRNKYGVQACFTNQENRYFIDSPNSFVVSSHGSFNHPSYQPGPQTNASCSNSLEVVDLVGMVPPTIKTSYCPNNYLASFGNKQVSENIDANRANIIALNNSLKAKQDGARTSFLLGYISQTGVPAATLKDSLVSKEFLSDTVLKKYFTKPGLSFTNLRLVFEKNAPLHPGVWSVVKALDFTPAQRNTLDSLQQQNKLSSRMVVESQLVMARNDFGAFSNEKIRRFLSESTGPMYDSIIKIYQKDELPNSKFKLVDTYIAAQRFDSAEARIASLKLVSANVPLCTILEHLTALRSDPDYAETMRADSSNFNFLMDQANSNTAPAEGYGKALLESVYNHKVEEIRLFPPESSGSRAASDIAYTEDGTAVSNVVMEQEGILIYPNPASTQLNIEVKHEAGPFKMYISNLAGQLLLEKECNKNCVVDLNDLPGGIYLLNLYRQNSLISTKKIVVINKN